VAPHHDRHISRLTGDSQEEAALETMGDLDDADVADCDTASRAHLWSFLGSKAFDHSGWHTSVELCVGAKVLEQPRPDGPPPSSRRVPALGCWKALSARRLRIALRDIFKCLAWVCLRHLPDASSHRTWARVRVRVRVGTRVRVRVVEAS